jgi:hypothetical protein
MKERIVRPSPEESDMSAESDVESLIRDPDIDAVEIKITVIAEQEAVVRETVREEDLEPVRRRVFFFDTEKLELFGGDVVLRARVTRDDDDDSTVKLRPVAPAKIGRRWKRETEGFAIELDIVGDEPTCSAKLEATQRRGEIDAVAEDKRAIKRLFSDDQEDLLREHKPDKVSWDDLMVLGPIQVEKWEWKPSGFPHEVTIEEWVLPDKSDFLELSIKVNPNEAIEAGEAFRALLVEHKLDPDGDSQAKTRWALEFFTQEP